jgi:anti-sigma regulatory factor (Ser/Thr protein kinase)
MASAQYSLVVKAGSTVITRTLPGDHDAPGAARVLTAALLQQIGPLSPERQADVTLAVSELVSNAVLHGPPGDVEFCLTATDDVIRIEVGDRGVVPFDLPHPVQSTGHWGLRLTQQFSDRCGIERLPSTLVWCEFDLARA